MRKKTPAADSSKVPWSDVATRPKGYVVRGRDGRLYRRKQKPKAGGVIGGANAQPISSPANPRSPVAANEARQGNVLLDQVAKKLGL